ncbi:helix-turn-helix transcriptional regulator [Clostridium paraputrificum]|uniref:helix-turn-helix domain-containing protein n=1 Tax=Clostridium paraputrificum TaxID=29363 RepID=UPI00232F0B6B|nr:helix-turn-helix transcriptional regulator [Clostridium paraputrificum]MDB2088645.1 helix-turn-helix transcriptional regulator [Clostridium paraputrificum]MDB2096287.1 helix-turn-helix transcriptional regulator [Clostridium paraputrificum]MDB2122403.1 helix-turn-helix transcriptional regulator [Clostridium paraputrificum]
MKYSRKKLGISQTELAKKLNISRSYLAKLESRNNKYHKNVTVGLIIKMSNILEVDSVKLFKYFSKSILY